MTPDIRICSLLFLEHGDQILLAMKKRGFGQGRWNGVGGKLEPGETPEQAAIRECQEEIGVTPQNLTPVAEHHFVFPAGMPQIVAYTFMAASWQGEPVETEEMAPQWFHVSKIPYDQMWGDDTHWLPQVLQGQTLLTRFEFNEQEQMIAKQVQMTGRWR